MEYRKLGRSDLNVSAICLGTMIWGEQNSAEEAFAQMDYALDHGVNFFDTSEMYAVPPRAETQGSTERIIGEWFVRSGRREEVVLATKVAGRSPLTWLRANGAPTEQSAGQITEAVDASLKRLQTDYIDLYQLHWPDRPMRLFGGDAGIYRHEEGACHSVGEILETLDGLVRSGKVRHVGLSNETPWGIMEFLHQGASRSLARMQSVQNAYNLLNRTFETGCSEIALREDVGLLAYSPLAQGYLTGKYQNGALPPGSRKQLFNRLQRYETPPAAGVMDAYLSLAQEHGLDPSQMANAFVTTRPFVTSNIIGARTMEQLELAVGSWEIELSDEVLKGINAIHASQPNPCP